MIPHGETSAKFAHGMCDRVRRGFYILIMRYCGVIPQIARKSRLWRGAQTTYWFRLLTRLVRVEGQTGTILRPRVLHGY